MAAGGIVGLIILFAAIKFCAAAYGPGTEGASPEARMGFGLLDLALEVLSWLVW